MNRAPLEAIDEGADGDRALNEMPDLEGTRDFFAANPMQPAARGTPALRAVRGATEDARFNATLKIGRIVGRHLGEEAILRIIWGMKDSVRHAVGHQEFRILAM